MSHRVFLLFVQKNKTELVFLEQMTKNKGFIDEIILIDL